MTDFSLTFMYLTMRNSCQRNALGFLPISSYYTSQEIYTVCAVRSLFCTGLVPGGVISLRSWVQKPKHLAARPKTVDFRTSYVQARQSALVSALPRDDRCTWFCGGLTVSASWSEKKLLQRNSSGSWFQKTGYRFLFLDLLIIFIKSDLNF